jgi:hypothetical protein
VVPEKQTTIITLDTSTTDPWMLFLYALKAPATLDKYIQRLTRFLDFLGLRGTKKEKARAFAAQSKADPNYAFNSVLRFFQSKREQIDRKEMAIGTVRNYVKSIKLLCDMADVQVPWAKITRGLPRAKRFADDRAPTMQEIRKIADHPDRRIKPVICTMASTGIRVGAWDYLKYGHITPIERRGKLAAAKVLVNAGTPDSYITFMTIIAALRTALATSSVLRARIITLPRSLLLQRFLTVNELSGLFVFGSMIR